MSFFSKLFELLPDADYLLSLEPEDLARPLLISLEDSQWIKPNEVTRIYGIYNSRRFETKIPI